MSALAAVLDVNAAVTPVASAVRPPLALVEAELAGLCRHLSGQRGSMQAGPGANPGIEGTEGNEDPDGQHTLQQLQVHLFLTASQLLPVWRDMCRDTRMVDQVEVHLDQLRGLTAQTLDAGPDDVMRQARCAVLAEDLQQHRVRSVVLLRALDAVVDADGLRALSQAWTQESARLLRARRQGLPLQMDNEDADPVGRPVR